MDLLYVVGLGLALWLLLAGLTLVVLRWLPVPGLARVVALLALTTLFFALEHGVGLGRLVWLLPLVLAGAAFSLWRHGRRRLPAGFVAGEAVFLLALLYGALWRHPFPGFVDVLDQISDLGLIAAYLRGETLPPVDPWLPTQALDYYYGFQHYAAGLFGRLLDAGPGYVFNGAPVVLAALVVALAWDFLRAFPLRPWPRALALAAFVLGGTGLAPFLHLVVATPEPLGAWDEVIVSSRFVGWFNPERASDLWLWLFGAEGARKAIDMPIETFGYQYLIGGYHAPLSSFLLLVLALTAMAWIERLPERRPLLEFTLGASTVLTLACHAWVFPLQAVLVGTWKVWDLARRPPPGGWRALPGACLWLAAGALAVLLLLLPYLAGLARHGQGLTLTSVSAAQRTPLWQFLLLFWPLFALAALALLGRGRPRLAPLFVCVFLPLLIGAELVNAYDPTYWGDGARFNPTLKWWGWIFCGLLLAGAATALAARQRWIRIATLLVLLAVASQAIDSARWWLGLDRSRAGQWDGLALYGADPAERRIIEYLATAPQGRVLQALHQERPIDSGIYASFALQRSVLGVPWILRVWRDDLTELPGLIAEIEHFYAGTHPAPLDLLRRTQARYVLWMRREQALRPEAWERLQGALAADYVWLDYGEGGDRVGLWRLAD